jgi:hypothetical protein
MGQGWWSSQHGLCGLAPPTLSTAPQTRSSTRETWSTMTLCCSAPSSVRMRQTRRSSWSTRPLAMRSKAQSGTKISSQSSGRVPPHHGGSWHAAGVGLSFRIARTRKATSSMHCTRPRRLRTGDRRRRYQSSLCVWARGIERVYGHVVNPWEKEERRPRARSIQTV